MSTSADHRVEVATEIAATPEQAWEAVATGAGITAWFMPAEITPHPPRVGGAVVHRHEAELTTEGQVTAYDAPRRFAYEEAGWMPDAEHATHPIATEFLVETRSGGTCVVRVVMSGFGDEEVWERAIESYTAGWTQALLSLRLYLERFAGQPVASLLAGGSADGDDSEDVWERLTAALGLRAEVHEGERIATAADGVPAFAGTVQRVQDRMITVLLDAPGPGIGLLAAGGPGEQVFVFVRAQLFGAEAQAVAEREQATWAAWFARPGSVVAAR